MEQKKVNNKKAQHEIVGFAIIIVIVAVIGLIFLSLSLGKGEVIKKTSVEISDFLQASMHYTTNCTTNYIPNYKNLQDLIKSCYRNEKCINIEDKMACEVLEETYSKIISLSFQVSDIGKNKAYNLNIYYEDLEINLAPEYIMNFTEGNFIECNSESGASQEIFLNPGQIIVELDFCYG
jgi:hypothetical protein